MIIAFLHFHDIRSTNYNFILGPYAFPDFKVFMISIQLEIKI